MKLVNIADEGAKYKWQLYDLYDKAFPEQEKKPLQVMENLVADVKMEMLAMVDEDEFVGLAINLIDAEQDRALLDYYAIVPEKRIPFCGTNPICSRRSCNVYLRISVPSSVISPPVTS